MFYIFYRKKDEKSSWKPSAGEALEKVAPGPSWEPFWDPKSIKIVRATPEKPKNRWKKQFWMGAVFWPFFRSHFSPILERKWVKIIVPVRSFFERKSDKTSTCCFQRALGCARVPPDTFFVDFGADFVLCFRSAGDPQHMHNIAQPILKTHLQSSEQHIRRNTF